MASEQVIVEITLDDGSIVKGFTKVNQEGKRSATKLSSTFGSSFSKLGLTIAAVGSALAAAFAGRKIIAAAAQQEAAVQELNTSLRLAGTFSEDASRSIQEFASSLQSTTRFGDEVILQQVALARNFARSNEEAQRLTAAAVDLSEATGISLDSAVKNLGKTFAGLTGELGESVPSIRALTAEQLKSGAAIDLIAKRFGGAASQNVQTFSGRIQQLENVFGDLLEQIGFIATRSPVLSTIFGFISERLIGLTSSLQEFARSKDVLGEFLSSLARFAEGVNTFVVAPLEFTFNLIGVVFNGLRTSLQAFVGVFAGISSQIASFFAPDSEIAQALRTFKESADATFVDFANGTEASLNSVFNFETSTSIGTFLEDLNLAIDNTLNKTGELATTGVDNFKKFGAETATTAKKAEFDIRSRIGAGISQAIQQTVTALSQGQNAFSAFAKATLSIIGDLAIQLGQFFIINGIAVEALKALGGAAAIAAGIALVTLGTILKSAGGGAQGIAPAAGAGGGIAAPGEIGATDSEIREDEDIREKGSNVTINVDGTVIDPKTTGENIASALQEFFDQSGGQLVVNA